MTSIYLYDTSAYLYAGDAISKPSDDVLRESLHGLPINGIRYVLRRVLSKKAELNAYVYCAMDSYTNKKDLYDGYKAQRTKNQNVFFQRELLKFVLPKLGIPMLIKNGYEADDLVYTFVQELVLNNKLVDQKLTIFSDDFDLAGAVMNQSISKYGIRSDNQEVLTPLNYESLFYAKGKKIPYNMALPYILCFGKPSNNVSRLSTASPEAVFRSIQDYLFGNYVNDNQDLSNYFSSVYMLDLWFKHSKSIKEFSDEVYNEIELRIPVVYPNLKATDYIDVGKLDKEFAINFLTLINETSLLNYLGIDNTIIRHDLRDNILNKFLMVYRQGIYHVDNFTTPDSSFFFEDADSMNVGGF